MTGWHSMRSRVGRAVAPDGPRFFGTLDMLRGVAAIAVVIYHERIGFGMMSALSAGNWAGHAYLAVDFFVQLSGFVIASAYDDRLRRGMTPAVFVRVRLLRLYPLIFAGSLFGLLAYLLPTPYRVPDADAYLVKALVLVPTYAYGVNAFPLDFPLWSIFFELLVNVFFAFCFRWLTARRIVMLVVSSMVLTVALAGVKNSIDFGAGYPGLPGGVPRTFLSFFVGVLLFRFRPALPAVRVAPSLAGVVLLGLLMMPVARTLSGAYDVCVVLLVFPALITLSATQAKLNGMHRTLGAVSYPVYAVHAPTIVVCTWIGHAMGVDLASMIPGVVTAAAVIVTAYVALKCWDEPVRQALARSTALAAGSQPQPRADPGGR